jgi:integrase
MDAGLAGAICRAKSPKRCGRRIGNWLGAKDVARLLDSIDPAEVKGVRDRAIFALGVGCGLRRGEIAALQVEQLQTREHRWVIVDLLGKHGRIRSVPMAMWIKQYIDDWCAMADIHSGYLFRALDKSGRVARASMTGQAIYEVVKTHSGRIGFGIAPHDLRRTFAKLAFAAHARIEQIQYSLGHGTIATTEAYLGLSQDLVDAPSDRIKLSIEPLGPANCP